MDEHRGRHGRGHHEHHEHHHEPEFHQEPPPRGLLGGLGIGGDWLDDYLPIILIILGIVGVYLWIGKQGEGGLGGLLGGFLK